MIEADPRVDVSVVLPCLDEAGSVEGCVRSALGALAGAGRSGEVIVVDNGSVDASAAIAAAAGARVVMAAERGYGNALRTGFATATGRYIVMADADGTYDLSGIPRFVAELDAGADLVVGDRMDRIEPGAMPWLHRLVGNPGLSWLLNRLFRTGVRDAHCGMRAFRRDVLERLDLHATGMELASEMVIRAGKAGLAIVEVPISYAPRVGTSKLSPLRDGWRHVRLLLVHAPLYLFVLPGLALATVGVAMMATVLAGLELLGRRWHLHTMMAGASLTVAGTQAMSLGLCARAFGTYFLDDRTLWFDRLRTRFRLEHALAVGGALIVVGIALAGSIFVTWARRGFASLDEERLAVLACTLVTIGIEVTFTAFLLSVIGLRQRR